jgi:serine/threonine protein kinase
MGLTAGTQIGPYEIAAPLGAGGMGEVYRAVDTRLGRQVAIKLLVASEQDGDRLRRFEVETRAVSSLQHANILALYDVGDFQARPFLVSELLHGETLRQRLDRSKLDSSKAIDLAIQLCHGLAAAHDKGIVHRDIKPENLFITKDGVLKILDFGIAKRTEGESEDGEQKPSATLTERTAAGTVLGTAGYMAPEQIRGQAADSRSECCGRRGLLQASRVGAHPARHAARVRLAILKMSHRNCLRVSPRSHASRRCLEKGARRPFSIGTRSRLRARPATIAVAPSAVFRRR